jgi:hypothetical protein
LLTDNGVWRLNDGAWTRTWDGNTPSGLTTNGEQVVVAWAEPDRWLTAFSTDGGRQWVGPETVVQLGGNQTLDRGEGNIIVSPGLLGIPFPALYADNTIEVMGLYVEDGGFTYPVVFRRQAAGWYPTVDMQFEPLLQSAADLRLARNFHAQARNGLVAAAWEAEQFNGAFNVYGLQR